MLLQIHDELVFSVPKAELNEVTQLIKEQMEGALITQVPLAVEIHSGSNWLEAH
jgi:DNA polymerase-1